MLVWCFFSSSWMIPLNVELNASILILLKPSMRVWENGITNTTAPFIERCKCSRLIQILHVVLGSHNKNATTLYKTPKLSKLLDLEYKLGSPRIWNTRWFANPNRGRWLATFLILLGAWAHEYLIRYQIGK